MPTLLLLLPIIGTGYRKRLVRDCLSTSARDRLGLRAVEYLGPDRAPTFTPFARLVLEEPEALDESSFAEATEDSEDSRGEKQRPGIDIAVNLPRKKVRSLMQLSGGERALTSIALIFAMSQVNPPPFLILDETDAALDEANSRRYGDMIENLAKHSQLIVITHNRETMSRASILYGVTMGGDGVSKLLSVKFEEAVAVAK